MSSSFSVFMVVLWFVPPDAYVQIYSTSAIRRSSLGCELWRSRGIAQFPAFAVPAVSWPPDSCHLASILATVACGLAHSSCASFPFWVERHSVPRVCLPYPWVDFFCLDGKLCRRVFLLLLFSIKDKFRALAWCRSALFYYSTCLSCDSG